MSNLSSDERAAPPPLLAADGDATLTLLDDVIWSALTTEQAARIVGRSTTPIHATSSRARSALISSPRSAW